MFVYVCNIILSSMAYIYAPPPPPFEKGGAYCFAHVGRYVGMLVGRYVGRSVCRSVGMSVSLNLVQLITLCPRSFKLGR